MSQLTLPADRALRSTGEAFPLFLAARASAHSVPYLAPFAALEWHVAQVSLAVEHRPLTAEEIQVGGADALAAASLSLQPGVRYMQANWAIDELFSAYLADEAPEQFVLGSGPIGLEVRGVRGDFAINPLGPGELMFRSALASGVQTGAAIHKATVVEPGFDAMRAVVSLEIASGLVTQVHSTTPAAEVCL